MYKRTFFTTFNKRLSIKKHKKIKRRRISVPYTITPIKDKWESLLEDLKEIERRESNEEN